jgi:hypothetical protein
MAAAGTWNNNGQRRVCGNVKQLLVIAVLATSARAGTCPSRDTLDALAKQAWGGVSLRPRCTAIRADNRLTFVVDIAPFEGKLPPRDFDPIRQGGYAYAAIVDDRGVVLWHQNSWAETPGNWYDWQLVDLDGGRPRRAGCRLLP